MATSQTGQVRNQGSLYHLGMFGGETAREDQFTPFTPFHIFNLIAIFPYIW